MGHFIHKNLVTQLGLMRIPRNPIPLMNIKGLKTSELRFQVTTTLRVGLHEERIVLDVAPIGSHLLILSLPWLQFHNPMIN